MNNIRKLQNKYVTRIHIKTAGNRTDLLKYCLNDSSNQFLAIGWSCVYKVDLGLEINSFDSYCAAIKKYKLEIDKVKSYRTNSVLNIFSNAKEDDLFWTRDEDGMYWICRVKDIAEARYDDELDIGAVIPVEAYRFGKEVPGQIKASFNRLQGGTSERIWNEKIVEYSKKVFNEKKSEYYYDVRSIDSEDPIDNLPDFELEELVILYIQKEYDYYLLPSSIAKKSTSIKIECEFISDDGKRAVVQVKGGNSRQLSASDFKSYFDDNYDVFLYAPYITVPEEYNDKTISITKEEILTFFNDNYQMLPKNITCWKEL